MSESSLLEKCCLIGEEVGGDPTHFMIERTLIEMGLDWRFMSFEPDPERRNEALTGADALGLLGVRLRGAFCEAAGALASATSRAKRTGRVTHLTRHEGRLQGDDATGPALVESLATALGEEGDPAGKRVVLLGAGGAAASIADVLIERGAALIAVADRSSERAAKVVLAAHESLRAVGQPGPLATEVAPAPWEPRWIDLPERFDWIVSTASWPKEQNLEVAKLLAPEIEEGQLLVDLGVGSSRSPLLLTAETAGLRTVDGLEVLVCENSLAIEAWTGEAVNRGVLRDAAEEFLGV